MRVIEKTSFLAIRLSDEQKESLQIRAERRGLKLSTYVRTLILKHLEEEDIPFV